MDCHAFEFMQRALQDLKKTAFNLDARVSAVLFTSLWCCFRNYSSAGLSVLNDSPVVDESLIKPLVYDDDGDFAF